MSRPTRVIIDLEAAKNNLSIVRRTAPSSKILAVIKADAYGHGLVRMARGFRSADAFGVASLEEAVALRNSEIDHRIVLMEGFFEECELDSVKEYQLDLVIHNKEQIKILKKRKIKSLPIWLKVNTGMNRLGFSIEEIDSVYSELKPISSSIILMSHLSNANLMNDSKVELQIEKFLNVTANYHEERTLANSGGILGWPSSHFQWVRPGLMLYGISPFSGTKSMQFGIKPVMTVQSKLIAVRFVSAGDTVGYGSEFVCPEDMMVGVSAYGYGDGYPRNVQAGSPVLVRDVEAKIIGCTMDMTILDLRGVENPAFGDDVTFWGCDLPIEKVSEALDTIPYELVCGVRGRSRYKVEVI